jgi:hypothetical protein
MSDIGSLTAGDISGATPPLFSDVGSVDQFATTSASPGSPVPFVVSVSAPAPAVAGFTVANKLGSLSSNDMLLLGVAGVAVLIALMTPSPGRG